MVKVQRGQQHTAFTHGTQEAKKGSFLSRVFQRQNKKKVEKTPVVPVQPKASPRPSGKKPKYGVVTLKDVKRPSINTRAPVTVTQLSVLDESFRQFANIADIANRNARTISAGYSHFAKHSRQHKFYKRLAPVAKKLETNAVGFSIAMHNISVSDLTPSEKIHKLTTLFASKQYAEFLQANILLNAASANSLKALQSQRSNTVDTKNLSEAVVSTSQTVKNFYTAMEKLNQIAQKMYLSPDQKDTCKRVRDKILDDVRAQENFKQANAITQKELNLLGSKARSSQKKHAAFQKREQSLYKKYEALEKLPYALRAAIVKESEEVKLHEQIKKVRQ